MVPQSLQNQGGGGDRRTRCSQGTIQTRFNRKEKASPEKGREGGEGKLRKKGCSSGTGLMEEISKLEKNKKNLLGKENFFSGDPAKRTKSR